MDSHFKNSNPESSLQVQSVHFSRNEIHNVIEKFYSQIQLDADLKIPFASVKDWPHHIDRLTHFWWMRFGGESYMNASYDPVEKHFLAGFNQVLLQKWLALFRQTLESQLRPDQVQFWASITEKMGQSLTIRNDARILASQK